MVKQIRDYVLEGRLIRESKEQKNEADYSKDWELYRNGAKGSFMQHLAQAFQQADMKNAKKLYDAFPEVGKLFILWKTNGQKDKI